MMKMKTKMTTLPISLSLILWCLSWKILLTETSSSSPSSSVAANVFTNDQDDKQDSNHSLSSKLISLLFAFFISVLYPASIYVWPGSTKIDRHESLAIKRNFISVIVVCLMSTQLMIWFRQWTNTAPANSHQSIGTYFVHKHYENDWEFVINCMMIPMLFIFILFIGPIVHDLSGYSDANPLSTLLNQFILLQQNVQQSVQSLVESPSILYWKMARNFFVAPISEELFCRGILIAILLPFWSKISTILISSLLFASMHTHVYITRYLLNKKFDQTELIQTIIQFLYTTFFGIFASVSFLSTGYLIAPILLHIFCNINGLPDFQSIMASKFYASITVAGFSIWSIHFINSILSL